MRNPRHRFLKYTYAVWSVVAAASLGIVHPSLADVFWTGAVNGYWSNSSNWSPGPPNPLGTDAVTMDGTGNHAIQTLGGNFIIKSLTVDAPDSYIQISDTNGGLLRLSGDASGTLFHLTPLFGTLTTGAANFNLGQIGTFIYVQFDNMGAVQIDQRADDPTNTHPNALFINAPVLGSAGFTKTGAGVLILTYSNYYSGNTIISDGTLSIYGESNLGSSLLTIGAGTLSFGGNAALTRAITLSSASSRVNTNGNNATFSGTLGGSGALAKAGAGTLTLSAGNTYSGGTSINGGTLSVAADGNFGALPGSPMINLTFDGGSGGTLLVTGNVSLNGNRNVSLSANGTLSTQSCVLTIPGIISGAGTLSATGNGTLVLNGANTHSGGTNITSGVVMIGNASALGSDGVTVSSGATLDLNGQTGVANSLTLNGNGPALTNSNTTTPASYAGTITLNSATTIDGAGSTTLSGTLNFNADLTKSGNGTLTISGTTTVRNLPNLSVSQGTLKLAQSSPTVLPLASVTLAGGTGNWTTLVDLNNNDMTVGSANNTSSFADIRNQITQAAGTPAPANPWNGTGGMTSSSAAAASTTGTLTALGYATGTEYTGLTGLTTFHGLTFNTTDTLVKYTLAGDANLDGTVNINDFFALSGHYGQSGDWSQGDFNYTGTVDINDFFIFTGNDGRTLDGSGMMAVLSLGTGNPLDELALALTDPIITDLQKYGDPYGLLDLRAELLAQGDAPITFASYAASAAPVPEPATLLLFAPLLILSSRRRPGNVCARAITPTAACPRRINSS